MQKTKRWHYTVIGVDLDMLDKGVALEGKYCTRARFVADAIEAKLKVLLGDEASKPAQCPEAAKLHEKLIKEGKLTDASWSDFVDERLKPAAPVIPQDNIDPAERVEAGNPFPT